jgi:hypothetical protein
MTLTGTDAAIAKPASASAPPPMNLLAEGLDFPTSAAFTDAYSSLLNALHTAFNGQPDWINVAIGLMYEFKMIAVSLMQTPAGDGSKMTAGPTFEYIEAAQAAVA